MSRGNATPDVFDPRDPAIGSFPASNGTVASSASDDNFLRQASGGPAGTNFGDQQEDEEAPARRNSSVSSTGSHSSTKPFADGDHHDYGANGQADDGSGISMSPAPKRHAAKSKKPLCPPIDCSSQKFWKKAEKLKPCLRGVGIGAAGGMVGTLILLLISLIWVGGDVVSFQNALNKMTPAADRNDPGTQLAKVVGVAALITFLLTAVGVCVVPKDKCGRQNDAAAGASDTPAPVV